MTDRPGGPTALAGEALLSWIELALPDPPWSEPEPFVGFVYLDDQAGLSAKGGRAGDPALAARPVLTVRLPIGVPSRILDGAEAAGRGLPARPDWLHHYGTQPPAHGPWRTDPALRGRFHRSFIDDVQVLVHDGEPRRSGRKTELCWVRVVAAEDGPPRPVADGDGAALPDHRGPVYVGELLNRPHQLSSVTAGDAIRFLADAGGRHPLLVTAAYLEERPGWRLAPCGGCGRVEGLDPPSVMARTRFPDAPADALPVMFTARCSCGGSQLVARLEVDAPRRS